MKISKMIEELKKTQDKFGDIEVIMASDSEGNSYSTIDENFRFSRIYEHEKDFIKTWDAGCISGTAQDAVDNFYKHAKVIGICLYPLFENMQDAEEAVKHAEKKKESQATGI